MTVARYAGEPALAGDRDRTFLEAAVTQRL
jgi:hypothetical protein